MDTAAATTPYRSTPLSWEEGDNTLREYRLKKALRDEERRRRRLATTDDGSGIMSAFTNPLSLDCAPSPWAATKPSRSPSGVGVSGDSTIDLIAAADAPLPSSRSCTPRSNDSASIGDRCGFMTPVLKPRTIKTGPKLLSRSASSASTYHTAGPRLNAILYPSSHSTTPLTCERRALHQSAPAPAPAVSETMAHGMVNEEHAIDAKDHGEESAESSIIIYQSDDQAVFNEADDNSPASATAATDDDDFHSTITLSAASVVESNPTSNNAQFTLATPAIHIQHSILPRHDPNPDESQLGIPSFVILDGKLVEIPEDMDILEKIDLLRRETAEQTAQRRAAREGAYSADWGTRDIEKHEAPLTQTGHNFKSLSDIAEKTETRTYSRTSTVRNAMFSDTDHNSDCAVAQSIVSGVSKRLLHSSLSVLKDQNTVSEASSTEEEILKPALRSTHSCCSNNNTAKSEDSKLSPSTPTKQRIKQKNSFDHFHDPQAQEKRSSLLSELSSTSSHPYTILPKVAQHTGRKGPPSSDRSLTSGILYPLPSPPKLAISPFASSQVHYVSANGKKNVHERSSRSTYPVKSLSLVTSAADASITPTPPRSSSPTKRALSPVVATRLAQFHNATPSKEITLLPMRPQTKSASQPSLSSISTQSASHSAKPDLFDSAIPPPTTSVAASKSTFELVKIYEQRTMTTVPALSVINASPVKDWLQSVKISSDTKSITSMQSQKSIASLSVSTVSEAQTSVSRRRSKSEASGLRRSSATKEPSKRETLLCKVREDVSPVTESLARICRSTSTLSVTSQASTSTHSGDQKVRSFAEASLDDSQIVCFGELMWLNSSSRSTAPVWQACRGIVTRDEQMQISWCAPQGAQERNFDLTKCQSATSVRRNGHGAYNIVDNNAIATGAAIEGLAGAIVPSVGTAKDRLHVMELVWTGRSHRFACTSLGERVRWLGAIFSILSRYSRAGSTIATPSSLSQSLKQSNPGMNSSLLARSLHSSAPLSSTEGLVDEDAQVSWHAGPSVEALRRQLEAGTQASLHASISEMLSSSAASSQSNRTSYELDRQPSRTLYNTTADDQLAETDATPPVPPAKEKPAVKSPLLRTEESREPRSLTDHAPTHSENLTNGSLSPSKGVARDLRKILAKLEREKTIYSSSSSSNGKLTRDNVVNESERIKSMHAEIMAIATQVKAANQTAQSNMEDIHIAEKLDELLGLCHQLTKDKNSGSATPTEETIKQASVSAAEQEKAALQRFETFMSALIERIDRIPNSQPPHVAAAPHIVVSEPDPRTVPMSYPAGELLGAGAFTRDLCGGSVQYDGTNSVLVSDHGLDEDAMLWTVSVQGGARQGDLNKRPSSSSTYRLMGNDVSQWQLSATPAVADLKKRATNESIYGGMDVTHINHDKQFDKSNSIISRLDTRSPHRSFKTGSPNPSTKASTGHIRDQRKESCMRLDGTHPDLVSRALGVATQPQSGAIASKCSPEMMTNKAVPSREASQAEVRSKLPESPIANVSQTMKSLAALECRISSASFKQRSSGLLPPAQADDRRSTPPVKVTRVPSPDPAFLELQQETVGRLDAIQTTLAELGSKETAIPSTEQQHEASIYLRELNEALQKQQGDDKMQFKLITDALELMASKLDKLPVEFDNKLLAMVSKFSAVSGPATPQDSKDGDLAAAPSFAASQSLPDNDQREGSLAVHTISPVKFPEKDKAKIGTTGIGAGASLLRKVSKALTPQARSAVLGGPRKMGFSGLLEKPSATDESRNKWKSPEKAKPETTLLGNPLKRSQSARSTRSFRNMVTSDEGAPAASTLEHLEEQVADAEEDGTLQRKDIEALTFGLLECVRMLKENKQRADDKEAVRAEKAACKDESKRVRHQREIMAIRDELAEWEMKRSELERANKDPCNQAGIETIIALLKDQMALQEQKLADLKEAVTPQMASINDDATQAIDEMKDKMTSDFAAFSKNMDSEVKKTLYEVAALRDQKKQLQTDIADLLAFKAKYGGGAPEMVRSRSSPPSSSATVKTKGPSGRSGARGPTQSPRPDSDNTLYAKGLRGPR